MAEETSLEKEESVRAWAGGKQDLIRLGEVIDGRFINVREQAIKELNQKLQRSASHNWLGRETKKSRQATQQRIQQALEDWQVKLELKDHENKLVKDEYRALLERTALRNVPQVTLSSSVEGQTTILRLSNGATPGSSLRVTGDPAWTRETFATVWSALITNKPGWSIMRHPATLWIGGIGLFAAGMWLFYFTEWTNRLPDWMGWGLLFAPYVIPALLIFIGLQLFPAFELTETGRATTRQRAIRIGGVLVGAIVTLSTVASALIGILNRPQGVP